MRRKDIGLGAALGAVLVLLACNASQKTEPTTVTRTPSANKSHNKKKVTVPIEEGVYLKTPPGQQKKQSQRPDFVFAYNADTAEHIRIFAANGSQAMLWGVKFNKVNCAHLDSAVFSNTEIDMPFKQGDSALIKTENDDVYVVGRGKLKQGRIEAQWRKLECE